METFSAEKKWIFIIISQQNNGDANLKKNHWLTHNQEWVKYVLSFGK